jgi:hypothetical protein
MDSDYSVIEGRNHNPKLLMALFMTLPTRVPRVVRSGRIWSSRKERGHSPEFFSALGKWHAIREITRQVAD